MRLVASLVTLISVYAVSWYAYNVVFHGSLEVGMSLEHVLMTAPAAQQLSRLSVFSQWPIYVPFNGTPSPEPSTITTTIQGIYC